jgi:hypothetical protein
VTEAEWDACTDPEPMLEFLRGRASARKWLLFACGCVRRAWPLLARQRAGRQAVEAAERSADGLGGGTKSHGAYCAWEAAKRAGAPRRARAALEAAYLLSTYDPTLALWPAHVASGEAGQGAQADLLRCVSTTPFRPAPVISPAVLAWEGGTVVNLARLAYQERDLPSGHLDPARLAVLADALEDAGCVDEHILGHVRRPGPHVRGCFVVDALLGQS